MIHRATKINSSLFSKRNLPNLENVDSGIENKIHNSLWMVRRNIQFNVLIHYNLYFIITGE